MTARKRKLLLKIRVPGDWVHGVQPRQCWNRVYQLLVVDGGDPHLEAARKVDSALSLPRPVGFLRSGDPRCAADLRFEQFNRQVLVARPQAHVPEILRVPLA